VSHRPGHKFFHVISHPARNQPVLLRATDYRFLLNTLNAGLERHPARVISYALLPTHWELVAGPADSSDLVRLINWVTITQNMRLIQMGRIAPGASPYAFSAAAVAPAADLVRICRLVERQPVALHLTERAEDWPWSSLADRFRVSPKLPLVTTRFLMSRAWLDLVNRPLEPYTRPVLRHLAEHPSRLAGLPQRREEAVRMRLGRHDDQAHSHVEGAEHLGVRHPSGAL